MLCLLESRKKVRCETAYHDQGRTVEDWPEWQEEFYGECPSSVYRVPYNKEGFVPLFFVTLSSAYGAAFLRAVLLRASESATGSGPLFAALAPT